MIHPQLEWIYNFLGINPYSIITSTETTAYHNGIYSYDGTGPLDERALRAENYNRDYNNQVIIMREDAKDG